jgi:site-specific DNA-methyltransferase (adenine-specific)
MNPISEVKNCDCMEEMLLMPNGFIDLAICDPEYGIGAGKKSKYHAGAFTKYTPKNWDSKPADAKFFKELFRVSKFQIIWGGNYFTKHLPPEKNWIVWDKGQPHGISLSMHELAFCNVPGQAAIVRITSASGKNNCTVKELAGKYLRIHPTQKPVALYEWLLKNYAKPGDKILDPMMGSQSSRIAAYKMGFAFYGYEKDAQYFREGCARFEKSIAMPLFDAVKMPEQIKMF